MLTYENISAHVQAVNDTEIIGQAKQPGDEWFIDAHNTYAWYRAIAAVKAPKRILELGVRYGYAGIAMIKGARHAGVTTPRYTGVDGEMDGLETNHTAEINIYRYGYDSSFRIATRDDGATQEVARIMKINTRNTYQVVSAVGLHYDIVHVDGDHSLAGILLELEIARMCVSRNGLILVDDIDTPHVRNEAEVFCRSRGIIPMFIPTFHGMFLIDMSGGSERF